MQRERLTAERFQQLADALGWQGERRWLLGARMVDAVPYAALSRTLHRSEGSLYDELYRAWKEVDEYEAELDAAAAAEEDEPEVVGMMAWALLWWHLTDRVWPLWAVVAVARWELGIRPDIPLDPEEQRIRNLELIAYKYACDERNANPISQ